MTAFEIGCFVNISFRTNLLEKDSIPKIKEPLVWHKETLDFPTNHHIITSWNDRPYFYLSRFSVTLQATISKPALLQSTFRRG